MHSGPALTAYGLAKRNREQYAPLHKHPMCYFEAPLLGFFSAGCGPPGPGTSQSRGTKSDASNLQPPLGRKGRAKEGGPDRAGTWEGSREDHVTLGESRACGSTPGEAETEQYMVAGDRDARSHLDAARSASDISGNSSQQFLIAALPNGPECDLLTRKVISWSQRAGPGLRDLYLYLAWPGSVRP